ncbi:methyltransferase domain-containing protein [Microcoleus sp. ZQ-A2]|nr:methyltransferase domain-containing protein [Microcoleus sp. FACHB-1]
MQKYLYLAPPVEGWLVGVFGDDRLIQFTERHKIQLDLPSLQGITDPFQELERHENIEGVVIGLQRGWLGWTHLRLAQKALRLNRRVWLYWPKEDAIERVDEERLQSHWRHLFAIQGYKALRPLQAVSNSKSALREHYRLARSMYRGQSYTYLGRQADEKTASLANIVAELEEAIRSAEPIPVTNLDRQPDAEDPLTGCGVYLRTDFWVRIDSGGSYGHTCHVAKELAKVTEKLVCFMPHQYSLLDDFGLSQVVLAPAGEDGSEATILQSTKHYYQLLKPAIESLRPLYIYERLCLGNYAGVLLSQKLKIPYIVEYNGSEISMKRSFDGSGYQYEDIYLKAEEAAFRQATLISVVSEAVKEDLVARGVDPSKILINPNGADIQAYAPLPPDKKSTLRQELGFDDSHRVIGFIGTFGGWHGIDVLAAAIPKICQQLPECRFLLIGDGNYKHLVDEQIAKHQLSQQVLSVGRVPQKEGARLLTACDIYVAPHNSHMVDRRFFGSPTKLFEYMALGGGIVASDLEQLGQVLSPALRPGNLGNPDLTVSNQRAVLCTPGDIEEFVSAVVELAKRPELCQILGQNARQAVVEHYAWNHHVAKLWRFLRGEITSEGFTVDSPNNNIEQLDLQKLDTGDAYKNETQSQWNNNPCGSQYVKQAQRHTLDWFLEVEAYRYGEYAPWMAETMEFAKHSGKKLLEIGAGIGTDLCQFALNGADVTDVDLSAGHLELAKENFRLRGLTGNFIHQDAEDLPFDNNSFDVVYSNGVIHHTPNTIQLVKEIYRVLKPGGKVIIMVYAENSLHYWRSLVGNLGLMKGELVDVSMGEIMSRHVEISENNAKPLVKVYTKKRLKNMFREFVNIEIVQRQITAPELPIPLRWLPLDLAGKLVGWNLVIKANTPEKA